MIPYSLSSVVALHHDYPTNNVQVNQLRQYRRQTTSRRSLAWRGQLVDSRGGPSGLDDVALRACGCGREAEGLVVGENKIPRLKGVGGPVQCSRRCVTVGNAWTSKRIDKGDRPCARRGVTVVFRTT